MNDSNVISFEWDEKKENRNIKLHGIDFSTAAFVFNDPIRLEKFDEKHSCEEERWITIGLINEIPIVVAVSYTIRESDTIRIISARRATKEESVAYYDYKKRY